MMLNKEIRETFAKSGFPIDDMILTCIIIYHGLSCKIADGHMIWLSRERLIERLSNGKIQLTFPLYLTSVESAKQEEVQRGNIVSRINEFRDLFKGIRDSSKGVKKQVVNLMEEWMYEHPDISFDTILDATRDYINNKVDRQFIPNADNFINRLKDSHPYSMLEIVVEEYLDNPPTQEKWL